MNSTSIDSLKDHYRAARAQILEDFLTFLRFPSISSEPEFTPQVLECSEWVVNYLKNLGFKTEVWPTSGHPALFASHLEAGADQPTLLIYNHYDVQPADPLELWITPPFEPSLRHGEIFARGAQDNKGQCFYVLQAIRLLLERDGTLPINIKLIIEGEEETGSAGLSGILNEKAEQLKADVLAIIDVGIPSMEAPAIPLGVRGIVTMDVEVIGSGIDLHSGHHGGIVYNPIHALAEMLALLRDQNGKISIPGFYDQVKPLSKEEKDRLVDLFDEEGYKKSFGALPTGGEKEFPPHERAGSRPTIEINGIFGGYTGAGFKTVIPSKAHAKLSCRLVPDQDPLEIAELVKEHFKKTAPAGIEVKVKVHPGVGMAVRSDINSRGVQAFTKAYEEVFSKPIGYTYEGGSIPIIHQLMAASRSEVVLAGLGLPDDHIHAPNEHFGLERIEKGCLIVARAIEHLSQ